MWEDIDLQNDKKDGKLYWMLYFSYFFLKRMSISSAHYFGFICCSWLCKLSLGVFSFLKQVNGLTRKIDAWNKMLLLKLHAAQCSMLIFSVLRWCDVFICTQSSRLLLHVQVPYGKLVIHLHLNNIFLSVYKRKHKEYEQRKKKYNSMSQSSKWIEVFFFDALYQSPRSVVTRTKEVW